MENIKSKLKKVNWKKFWRVLDVLKFAAFAVVIFLGLISLLTLLPLKTPIKPFIVMSGSMNPTIPQGSIVFVKRDVTNIQNGDIITFIRPNNFQENVTHRIVSSQVQDGKTVYKTRGDANNTDDQWIVKKEAIWGKAIFSVPVLGYLVDFSKTKLGVVLVIALPLLIIAMDEARVIYVEMKKLKNKKNSKDEKEKETKPKKKTVSKKLALILGILILPFLGSNSATTYAVFTHNDNINNNQIVTNWWVKPTVALLSLNGGQNLYQKNNYSIIWSAQASDPVATLTINLYYSTDGGATYPNVISTGEVNDGIYKWTVPSVFSNTVRIKVVATDGHGLANFATSASNLSIVSPIVLNEFLPNPAGADDAPKPNGEWVELYNNGKVDMDVNGWTIYDALNHALTISATNSDNNGNPLDAGETVVPSGGFLVVYKNAVGSFFMNNNGGDIVKIYNGTIAGGANLIDSHSYTLSPVPDNKSFARIPDGTGSWVDPDPTPGKPNVTTENYLLLPENKPTNSPTPTPVPTNTATPEGLINQTPTSSPTPTATPTPTDSPTLIPTPTVSPSPILTPSSTPTNSPDPTATP